MRSERFFFDTYAADLAVAFFPACLKHIEGEWAGQPLELAKWQVRIVKQAFGWMVKCCDQCQGMACPYEHFRRYRIVYIEIPRKNGKSTLAAGIAHLLSWFDDEPGAQVYSAAADRKQASIVFRAARLMRDRSPELTSLTKAFKTSITGPNASFYQVLSADVETKHGLNCHGVIFDELHAQKKRDLWDVLISSTGTRRQPMVFVITTAGMDENSICYEQHEYALKVKDGTVDDPTFLPVLYGAKQDADWKDPKVWARANPNLGISLKPEYLEQECARAQASPRYENTFKRLHLNIWTEQSVRWLPLDAWDSCAGELNDEDLLQRVCFGGLDLSTTTDTSALALWFPFDEGKDRVKLFFWLPEENMRQRVESDRVPYDVWASQGYIKLTQGNTVDYEVIEKDICAIASKYQIRELAFDPWNATMLAGRLANDGLTVLPFQQSIKNFSAPTKELERLVISHEFLHGGNPVLRWNARNVSVRQDASGNIRPDKAASKKRIDGIVATIEALDRSMRNLSLESRWENDGAEIILL